MIRSSELFLTFLQYSLCIVADKKNKKEGQSDVKGQNKVIYILNML